MQIALGKLRRDLPQHPFLLRSLPAAPFLPFLPFLLSVVFFIASIILPPQAIEVSILLCFYASMLLCCNAAHIYATTIRRLGLSISGL